jgi:hypothetical protein
MGRCAAGSVALAGRPGRVAGEEGKGWEVGKRGDCAAPVGAGGRAASA